MTAAAFFFLGVPIIGRKVFIQTKTQIRHTICKVKVRTSRGDFRNDGRAFSYGALDFVDF